MQKIMTRSGYIAYKTTAEEVKKLGSICVCDECGRKAASGYLVPVLNHWMCESCFDEWQRDARYYPADVPIQNRRAAYYESVIPCTAFAV